VPLEPGVGDMMTIRETERYWAEVAASEHLSQKQVRNQGLQTATWPSSLSEEQIAVEQAIAEGHRKAAADPVYNGQDSVKRLRSHDGERLDY
jgi:hypothetical protein